MKYTKANQVLPEELILEIQKYVQGETIYIPKKQKEYQKWGTSSGSRQALDRRNIAIKDLYDSGMSMEQLATNYYLSVETIRKIVYSHKK